jgi:hypothetical protein
MAETTAGPGHRRHDPLTDAIRFDQTMRRVSG